MNSAVILSELQAEWIQRVPVRDLGGNCRIEYAFWASHSSISRVIEGATSLTGAGPQTFEEFLAREHLRLFRALVVVTRDPHQAEELTQEAFVRVWEKWETIRSIDRPTGYLHRTAFNAFLDVRRKVLRAPRKAFREILSRDPLEIVEARDVLERAILQLPPRQRAALVVVDLLGYAPNEAAGVLGVQPGTVRRLVSQARAKVRAYVREDDHG